MKFYTLILMTTFCCLTTMPTQAQETEELEELSVTDLMRLQAQAAADFEDAQDEFEAAKARLEQAALDLEESCSEEEQEPQRDYSSFRTFPAPQVAIQGSIDKSTIDRVIKQHLEQLYACHPNGTRLIIVEFYINYDGEVTSSDVTNLSDSETDLELCVNDIFAKMEFPRPQIGTYVHTQYPIILGWD
jgi:hypothetical protein